MIKGDWLEPGMHINNVRNNEVSAGCVEARGCKSAPRDFDPVRRSNVSGVATGSDGMFAYIAGNTEERSKSPFAASRHRQSQYRHGARYHGRALGGPGRRSAGYVLNNQGTQGLQFAAVGGTAYNLAKAKGLGPSPAA